MTAPGGSSGEGSHDDPANPPPAGQQRPEQPVWQLPGGPQASSPVADYPSDTHPGYSPYPEAPYPSAYPPGYPPPGFPQPGYPQPMPTPYGMPPGGGFIGGPPPYPDGYYPLPDYYGGYGAAQPGMNTMAIISLISSIVGVFCCLGSIVSIVLGAMAMNDIKRTREEGYGLAVAGIVISVATLLVYLVIMIFSVRGH